MGWTIHFYMLKLLPTSCILHLFEYTETHATQCFAIVLESFNKFFYIFWNINIYT